ncbi:TA system VapC family ribonuclease toxin [Microbacterium sp. 18062]|uniref:TA system VapC family ribonuclease toxin n=1 Tax=Microbacterium sp. 18062 TaxID=2681410 RepID=UPI00135BA653|nr:TA system VapC family ribonuclease toxin [Microbacterium sp. 18062]
MIVVDVNVLVAAHLAEHVHHERALAFLGRALTEDLVIVPDAVWSGFLRIVTNGRIFETPSTIEHASEFVRAVVGAAGYRHVSGLVDGIEPFLRLCATSDASANLVPDGYIAAVALAHRCPVATFDRDFRRFDGIEIVTPE